MHLVVLSKKSSPTAKKTKKKKNMKAQQKSILKNEKLDTDNFLNLQIGHSTTIMVIILNSNNRNEN